VLAVAYFLTLDYRRIQTAWQNFSIPGYEGDLDRLRRALNKIWDSFLRGQLLIVLITGVLTSVLMTALGVRFSIGLGVLGGLAKFVPIVGPVSAGAVAALVAIFQPENWFGLDPFTHAILIVACVIVLDQSIDYILLPRIMGTSLNLHPVVILVAAIVGASLAGVIGLLLSAPSTASLLLLTRYTFRKMVDLSPWDPPIDESPKVRASRLLRLLRRRQRPAEEGQEAG
jgi:predicted PurR-regulated permease PerM